MSEHTKEPWEARHVMGSGMIQAFDFRAWAIPVFNKGDDAIDGAIVYCTPEDARRIVACVNACVGIPTETLASTVSEFRAVLAENDRVFAVVVEQRDKLLAALKEAAKIVNEVTDYGEFMTLQVEWRAIIAEVEAGK